MAHLGFEYPKADPDFLIRRLVRKDGETVYQEYVLLYVDDCLVISDRAESIIKNEIGKYFCLKEESIGDPGQYLGGKMRELVLENGMKA